MVTFIGDAARVRLAIAFAIAMFLLNGHYVGKYRGAVTRRASVAAMNPTPAILPAGVTLPILTGRSGGASVSFPPDEPAGEHFVVVVTQTCWGCALVFERLSTVPEPVRRRLAVVDLTARGEGSASRRPSRYPDRVTLINEPDVTSLIAYNLRLVPQLLELDGRRRLVSVATGEASVLDKLKTVSAPYERR